MKIAVISAHYMPEVGYQEVHLAKAYARLGHTVKVYTSVASVNLGGSIGNLKYKKGLTLDSKYGYEIQRLPVVSFKSKAIPWGLQKAVSSFGPDIIIMLGVAKIFPAPLLRKKFSTNSKIISIYGDAREYLDRGTLKQKLKSALHELGYSFIKYPLYRRALKHGAKLVLNIPETNELFLNFLNQKEVALFESKKLMLNLGFDPDEYYFNLQERLFIRKELGVNDDELLIITSTRINKRKNLEEIVRIVSNLNSQGKKVTYLLVGFLGDDYEQELKAFIARQPFSNKFKCFGFLSAGEIRSFYCAADVGIWLKAAISIQEAMGTGLPVILENKPSVNHLVTEGLNGWYFNTGELAKAIDKALLRQLDIKENRKFLSEQNAKKLSYDAIAQKILNSITP